MDLFMVEVRVSSWSEALHWYRDRLGLAVEIEEPEHRFALLRAGSVRVALKGADDANSPRGTVSLVFEVADLDAERQRLAMLGVAVGTPIENAREGYQEVRLTDPDGTPIRLFAWSRTG